MPPIRVTSKRTRAFYGEWTRAILEILATTGGVALVALLGSPRAHRAFALLPRVSVEAVRAALWRLRRRELIAMAERPDGEVRVTITERGRHRLLCAKVDELTIPRAKRWDRQWRVVIFDIPEEHKIARQVFQRKLCSLMFAPVQRSVYVTPYPCQDALEFLCEVYEVRPFVHCFEVPAPSFGRELDERMRRHFKV